MFCFVLLYLRQKKKMEGKKFISEQIKCGSQPNVKYGVIFLENKFQLNVLVTFKQAKNHAGSYFFSARERAISHAAEGTGSAPPVQLQDLVPPTGHRGAEPPAGHYKCTFGATLHLNPSFKTGSTVCMRKKFTNQTTSPLINSSI